MNTSRKPTNQGSIGAGCFRRFPSLRNYIRLYPIVVAVWIIITFTLYAFTKPQYTAEALVGPPGPSPTDSMLSSITDGGVGGIARKVLGGSGASGSNDPYQEYLQLLPSSRLSQVLIEKDHLLQIIYSDRWDADTKRWKTGGPLHFVTDPIKRLLHRPIYYGPDTDTLTNYLSHSLTVVGSSNGAGSMLIPGTATYTKVSFEYDDPHQAEEILEHNPARNRSDYTRGPKKRRPGANFIPSGRAIARDHLR